MAKGKKVKSKTQKKTKPKVKSPPKKGKPTKKKKPAKKQVKEAKPKKERKAKAKIIPDFISGLPGNPEIKEVSIKDIELNNTDYQLRTALRVGDLAANIKKHGQKIPVILRGQKEPYQIISGFRRIEAIKKIGWTKVNAIIIARISEEEALKICVLENEYRKTYNDLDRAHAIQRYRKMGKSVKEIAEDIFHLSRRRIENLEKLLSFDKILLDALEKGEIPTAIAILLQQSRNKHKGFSLKSWLQRVRDEELSYHALRKAIKKEYGEKPKERTSLRLFDEIKGEKGAVSLRFWPVKLDLGEMGKEEASEAKAMLERALNLVKKITG